MRSSALLLDEQSFRTVLASVVGRGSFERLLHIHNEDLLAFYSEIVALAEVNGLDFKVPLAGLIGYSYSIVGGQFRSQLELHSSPEEYFEKSIKLLFSRIFRQHCQQILRAGAFTPMPLEDLCYSIWDFPCGLRSFFFHKTANYQQVGVLEIQQLLRIDHVLIQESAIHASGLLATRLPRESILLLQSAQEQFGFGHPLYDFAGDWLERLR